MLKKFNSKGKVVREYALQYLKSFNDRYNYDIGHGQTMEEYLIKEYKAWCKLMKLPVLSSDGLAIKN